MQMGQMSRYRHRAQMEVEVSKQRPRQRECPKAKQKGSIFTQVHEAARVQHITAYRGGWQVRVGTHKQSRLPLSPQPSARGGPPSPTLCLPSLLTLWPSARSLGSSLCSSTILPHACTSWSSSLASSAPVSSLRRMMSSSSPVHKNCKAHRVGASSLSLGTHQQQSARQRCGRRRKTNLAHSRAGIWCGRRGRVCGRRAGKAGLQAAGPPKHAAHRVAAHFAQLHCKVAHAWHVLS